MAQNIEIKACARDFPEQMGKARALSDGPNHLLHQEDIYYHAPRGRLKMRHTGGEKPQLIFYERADDHSPKSSHYDLIPLSQPQADALHQLLSRMLGVRAVVNKARQLFIAGETRIHLDTVENLGQFLELEVVMQPGQPQAQGEKRARQLMQALNIRPEDLIAGSYVDLLTR